MKRVWVFCLISFALLFLILLLIPWILHVRSTDTENVTSWQWIREDSYLVDIQLDDDNKTVVILYSFCFSNPTESAYALAPISANFAQNDLAGWMDYQQFFVGERQDGNYYTVLQPQETTNVIYSFSGKYLGGEISTHIDPPAEIMYMVSYPQ